MNQNEQNQPKEAPGVFGGYTTRHDYEKHKTKKPLVFLILKIFLTLVLVVLSAFGVIHLGQEYLSPATSEIPEGGGSVQLPSAPTTKEEQSRLNEQLLRLSYSQFTVGVRFSNGDLRYGSGFLVSDETGGGVCSASLLEGGVVREVFALGYDGTKYEATLLGKNEEWGVALFEIDPKEFELVQITLSSSGTVNRGETLFAVGSVQKKLFYGTTLTGVAASVSHPIPVGDGETTLSVILMDADFNATVAGAPVMNLEGQVVGFCTDAIESPFEGMTVVIPMNSIYTAIQEISAI